MNISIIVCVYNGEKYINSCFVSLLPRLTNKDELIIIEDGSTDGTSVMLNELYEKSTRSSEMIDNSDIIGNDSPGLPRICQNIKILSNKKNRGLGYSRNKGFKNADNEIILYIDCDTEVTEKTLEIIRNLFKDKPELAAAGGRGIENNINNVFDRWRKRFMSQDKGTRIIYSPDYLSGLCLAIRKNVLEITGGFTEIYRTNAEDVDFTYKLKRYGYEYIFNPDIYVYHNRTDNFVSIIKFVYRHIYWACRVHRINKNSRFIIYFLASLKCLALQCAVSAADLDIKMFLLSIILFFVRLFAVAVSVY